VNTVWASPYSCAAERQVQATFTANQCCPQVVAYMSQVF